MVGSTGAGKTTLVDGMINYVTDVSFEDDFRFTMVDLTSEEKGKESNQVLVLRLHDRIIPPRGEVWSNKVNLTSSLFIDSYFLWCLTPLSAIFQLYYDDQF